MCERLPTVLLVEDHKDSRDILAYFLHGLGCQILEAADGREALDRAREAEPDLILMDLNLPRLSGLEATALLKAGPTKTIPVIAVSSDCGDSRWKDKALAVGCEDCVCKPVDFLALAKIIDRFLPGMRLSPATK